MLTFIICLLFTSSLAQLNGEFWWLNPKLNQYRKPARPQFEDLSEFETDQSAKIVFKDDDDRLPKEEKFEALKANGRNNVTGTGKSNDVIKFQDKSEIVWPDDIKEAMIVTEIPTQAKQENKTLVMPSASDILELKFPNDTNLIWRDKQINNTKENKYKPFTKNVTANGSWKGTITLIEDRTPVKVDTNVVSDTESICTYMKKTECSRLRGVAYVNHESGGKQPYFNTQQICCILPMRAQLDSSKIYFFDDDDDDKPCNRRKRSEKTEINPALKQRNNLLLRKFGPQVFKPKLTTSSPIKQRVVTPSDDYVDPYWNIKGPNSKSPNKQNQFHQTQYEYETEDYVEDYVVEIPRPGLVGLYSDNEPSKRPSWTFPTEQNRPYGDIDSEEERPSFGYSPTVDPRLEDRRPSSNSRIKGRPVKMSTASNDRSFDAESQTISYHSNPDFQVLQGFKLLNLVRNKSRIFRNGKKTTTEKFYEEDTKDHVLTTSLESDYDDSLFNKKGQIFKDCGKVAKDSNRYFDNDKETGSAGQGSHPSLGLLVLTKKKKSVLCYATIVHPKAAISAADCVHGRTTPGEIMLIAGAWRLDEESREEWQKRMTTVHVHPKYEPGELAHNLAVLYWQHPLRLTPGVQPACLSDAHVGDDCRFFGWGGYDQAMRKQSRWQRALVLAPRTCAERVSNKRLPKEAFCAAVQSRGTVTGTGGALICAVGGRQSAVGVAVWRDLAVVLLPAREWLADTFSELNLR